MKPFAPKSTSYISPGQFWSIPLSGGRFGCGIVLALVMNREGTIDTRLFLAGLLEWIGDSPPVATVIQNSRVIATRFAHIKTIQMAGGELIGEVAPWWDRPSEIPHNDDIPTAGYNVFRLLAEEQAESLE